MNWDGVHRVRRPLLGLTDTAAKARRVHLHKDRSACSQSRFQESVQDRRQGGQASSDRSGPSARLRNGEKNWPDPAASKTPNASSLLVDAEDLVTAQPRSYLRE